MENKFTVTKNKTGAIGNYYNKYDTKNIIEKIIIDNYFRKILDICTRNSINKFIDIGCGEGKWLYEFSKKGFNCIGTDQDEEVIRLAKKNIGDQNFNLFKSNIYDENFVEIINSKIGETGINNIFFLEVLEHLNNPLTILKKFKEINFQNMILTVPKEPLWRFLNCCRLKYLYKLGNTPGHINHFSYWKLKKILNENFKLIEMNFPIPFLICLIKNA